MGTSRWNGISFRSAPELNAVVQGRICAHDGTKWWGYHPVYLHKDWLLVVEAEEQYKFDELRQRKLDMDNLWLPIRIKDDIRMKLVDPNAPEPEIGESEHTSGLKDSCTII